VSLRISRGFAFKSIISGVTEKSAANAKRGTEAKTATAKIAITDVLKKRFIESTFILPYKKENKGVNKSLSSSSYKVYQVHKVRTASAYFIT
jgi:hypothetical protein